MFRNFYSAAILLFITTKTSSPSFILTAMVVDASIYEECAQIISSSNSENTNNEQAVDLVQNFPNEFFATLLSANPLPESTLSLIKFVILSLEGEFKQLAQSALCDTFSVLDLPYEDAAMGLRLKLKSTLPDDQNAVKMQLDQVSTQRKPLYDLVRALIMEGYLSSQMLSQRIGASGLSQLGLIGDPTIHQRKEARANTAAIYRQHRFNLHREVAEGFAKMSTLILSSMGDGDAVGTIRSSEYIEAEKRRAFQCWIGIEKLIGFFDLDPLRALSTILDIFSSSIASHWRFFLALLDCSPWRRKTNEQEMQTDITPGKYENWDFKDIIQDAEQGRRQPLNQTRNTNGNSSLEANLVIAQVLGFQMRYYQRKQSEKNSDSCYHLCALLIREDYVSLLDLLPHLHPDDKTLNDLKSIYKDTLSDRLMSAKTTNNKLAMAAPLSDDMPTAALNDNNSSKEDEKDEKKEKSSEKDEKPFEPPMQKVCLIISLLSVGALKEGFFLLSLYPHIPYIYPRIIDIILRIAEYSMEPVYEPISTRTKRKIDKKIGNTKQFSCEAPTPVASEKTEHVFYYDKWTENVPQVHTIKETLTVIDGFLKFVGPCCSRNSVFFQKLLRLASHESQKAKSETCLEPWISMTRNYFLPGLALSISSNTLSIALWDLMKRFPLHTRYQLYGEMRGSTLKRLPEVRVKYLESERDAKSILRRLSSNKAYLKVQGRAIGKISHTNPVALFHTVLQQVQSYENIALPVINGLNYLSELSYDVFTYTLLDFFTDPAKERTKLDGTNASLWLQSLATFTGGLFRRQVNYMDPSPLLMYVGHELKRCHVKDLIIFREILKEMSGIHPLSDLSDDQIIALSAGPSLKSEAIPHQMDSEVAKFIKKSSKNLRHALHTSNLTIPMLVLIAQQLQVCVYMVPESEAHPKHLSTLYDETVGVLLQYIAFLRATPPLQNDPWSTYEDSLPSFEDLVNKFGLDIGVAFAIIRPKVSGEIYAYEKQKRIDDDAEKAKAKEATDNEGQSEQVMMEGDKSKPEADDKGGDVKMETDVTSKAPSTPPSTKDVWHPMLSGLISQMSHVLSDKIKQALSPAFVTTFWQLSMYDISVPIERYGQESAKLQSMAKTREWSMVDKETGKSKASTVPARKDALNSDMHEHMKVYEATKKRISNEKQHWFSDVNARRNSSINFYIQYCIMPRVVLSPEDALYCARFSKLMHNYGVPSFPTLLFLDRILCESPSAILSSSTENEARNYARFLTEILSDVSAWQKNEEAYNKGARGTGAQPLPGFRKSWDAQSNVLLTYEEFKKAFSKWQSKLLNAFTACVSSGEYMHVRNAVIVFNIVSEFFPESHKTGESMYNLVKELVSNEKRNDLKILAQGYLAQLSKRRHSWGGADPEPHKPITEKKPETKSSAPAEKTKIVENKVRETKVDESPETAESTKPVKQAETVEPASTEAPAAPENTGIGQEASLRARIQSRTEPPKEVSIKRDREKVDSPATTPAPSQDDDRRESQPKPPQGPRKSDSARNNGLPPKPGSDTTRQNSERTPQQSQKPRSPVQSSGASTRRRSPPPSRPDSPTSNVPPSGPQSIRGRAAASEKAGGGSASLLSRFEPEHERNGRSGSGGGRNRNRSLSPPRGGRKYDQRDRRDGRDEREGRDARDNRDNRDNRDRRDQRDQRDSRDSREQRDHRDRYEDDRSGYSKRRRVENEDSGRGGSGRYRNEEMRKSHQYEDRASTNSKRSRNDQSRAFESAMSVAGSGDDYRRKRDWDLTRTMSTGVDGKEPSKENNSDSPKRNVIRKYGRARPAEAAQEVSATSHFAQEQQQKPYESNMLDSDDEGGEDASYADLRKELGIGGWNDEVEAIDAMPEEQLRTLPANLIDEFDSDGEETQSAHKEKENENGEDFSLSMAEQRQLVEKEEGSADHNPQESRLPLPFEEEEMDFTADRIKKPKGLNKKEVDNLHRETARMVRDQNVRLESRSDKMTLADYYAKLAIKRGHAENKAEETVQADEEQPPETTLLTTSKDTPAEHAKADKYLDHQPEEDILVQQDIDAMKTQQSEKLRHLKVKALESAHQKSQQLKKSNKEQDVDEDIEILADESAVGPVARTAGARLGAGHEDATSKMSAKRRWDSREAHKIRKFVGISERGGSGAKRRRSSEGTPNKKGKMLTNEELMESIRQKTLNQELQFKDHVEELERVRKNKYNIPKPKTELSERIDPVEAAIKRAERKSEIYADIGADDEVDSDDDAEDEDWAGSADEEEDKPAIASGSERGSEEPDENEIEKENHSSFSSNATSGRPENTRKPLGEATGHAYDNASDDSDGEVRGYRRIRRIINDDKDEEQNEASKIEGRLESPFKDNSQPEFYMNEDGLLTQSKPSMEFAEEGMQVDRTEEVKHGNQLRRRSYVSDNDDEGYVARKPMRQTQQATQATQPTQVTEATQAATQPATEIKTQQLTQIEPIPTMKESTQATQAKQTIQAPASPSYSDSDSEQEQPPKPSRSAFDTLKKGMKRQEERQKRPIDPRYFEAQAEISDEDNLVGLISDDEEDDERNNRQLDELVNDDRVARETRDKQDKLATEKYQEQLKEDDELDKKVAQNAADGRYRYRRRHRNEDGLEMSSDDDDIEFMKAQEQLATRLAKRRRKQAGEEPMERYARNPSTAAFVAAFEAPANAEDFEADFDVEHTGGPLIEQPEHRKDSENSASDSVDEDEDSDVSESTQQNDSVRVKKQMTLKEEAAAMRNFMERKHAYENIQSSDSEDESQAMQFVRKGDPGKQKQKPRIERRENDDEDTVPSYAKGRRPLSPRSLSKLKKYAQDEGSGVNYSAGGGRKGVTSFLSESNSAGVKKKHQSASKTKPLHSQSQQSSQSKPSSKLSSFGKWS
ncbi:hypothetical protein E3P77_00340 [Wallemia ichthyophaga]|nr:hypothetical protein E3P77_00340 [Wallemia ichthyophaga]